MTNREFYNAIVTGTVTLNVGKENEVSYSAYENGALIAELVEFAKAGIEKINAKNEAAKGKPRAKKPNEFNEGLISQLVEAFKSDEAVTAKAAAIKLNELNPELVEPITTQKSTALLKKLVAEGVFVEKEIAKSQPKEYVKV